MLPAVLVTLYGTPIAFGHSSLEPVMADVVGLALIVIGALTAVPAQPAAFVSVTLTFPAPAAPHCTVMMLVLLPVNCVPPVIVHE